jgi:hypothetical protein
VQLVELVLDLGRVPRARFPGGVEFVLGAAALDRITLDALAGQSPPLPREREELVD